MKYRVSFELPAAYLMGEAPMSRDDLEAAIADDVMDAFGLDDLEITVEEISE